MQFQTTQSGNVQGSTVTMLSQTWNPALGGGTLTKNIFLNQPVQGFKVFLGNSTTVQNIELSIANNTNEDLVVVDLQIGPSYPQLGAQVGDVVVPIQVAGNTGDSITFSLTKLAGGGAAANVSIALVGLGESPSFRTTPGLPIADVPMGGLLGATAVTVVGNVAILPAPPTGMAYRLHSVIAFNAAGRCWLAGGGFTYGAMSQAGTGNEGFCPLFGNLCLTALNINSGTAGTTVTIQYDLVSVPTILG